MLGLGPISDTGGKAILERWLRIRPYCLAPTGRPSASYDFISSVFTNSYSQDDRPGSHFPLSRGGMHQSSISLHIFSSIPSSLSHITSYPHRFSVAGAEGCLGLSTRHRAKLRPGCIPPCHTCRMSMAFGDLVHRRISPVQFSQLAFNQDGLNPFGLVLFSWVVITGNLPTTGVATGLGPDRCEYSAS